MCYNSVHALFAQVFEQESKNDNDSEEDSQDLSENGSKNSRNGDCEAKWWAVTLFKQGSCTD